MSAKVRSSLVMVASWVIVFCFVYVIAASCNHPAAAKTLPSAVGDWESTTGGASLYLADGGVATLSKGELESKGKWSMDGAKAIVKVDGPAGFLDVTFEMVETTADVTILAPFPAETAKMVDCFVDPGDIIPSDTDQEREDWR